ncbi:MAG: glutamine--tRNA ligase/YqeY domain fusion protein [Candidatus Methylacidiphilales bacterium]
MHNADSLSAPVSGDHFIRQIIREDVAASKNEGRVVTRFPPEPNGYLHIGHAKAVCLSFGMAREFGGRCHLRFDDTNPAKEDLEFVQGIQRDIRWLGFDWGDHLYHASDYFETFYNLAVQLIQMDKAYVCELTPDQMRTYRGTPTAPSTPSPWRDRPAGESLDLFSRMRAGEFEEGTKTLRAKIDLASPNMHLRDPAVYRIRKAPHWRTGSQWCIYPMYDYAHCVSDSLEQITHSLCSLEFEVHRPLYDWFLETLGLFHSRQYEFARLNLSYTVMSKRKLLELVETGMVSGWDDPRMPTLCGLRRRGVPPEAIRNFCDTIGVTKFNGLTDVALLEHSTRTVLNKTAARFMGVMDPLKVVITNWPQGEIEWLEAVNNPEDPEAGTRSVPFSSELWIERGDFMEDAPKKFFRLAPGREVRLRWAYFLICDEAIKDADGQIIELRCRIDPATRGGDAPDGRKVKATIHWVSASHAVRCETRLYDRLFNVERPDGDAEIDFKTHYNPHSLQNVTCLAEPGVAALPAGTRFQFERIGYFCVDPDTSTEHMVLNRTVGLKDDWAKVAGQPEKA